MAYMSTSKVIRFEGEAAEEYKRLKKRWLRLAVVGVLLPFVFTMLVSLYNNLFDVISLLGNGEIILSLFSLTVPMLFDLFEAEDRKNDKISGAFFLCIIVTFFQILLYCLIRIDDSEQREIKSIIISVIMIFASLFSCFNAIKCMYASSISKGGVDDEN